MPGLFVSMLLAMFATPADACLGDFETLHVTHEGKHTTWPFATTSGTLICERHGGAREIAEIYEKMRNAMTNMTPITNMPSQAEPEPAEADLGLLVRFEWLWT